MKNIISKYKENLRANKNTKIEVWKKIKSRIDEKEDLFFWFKINPAYRVLAAIIFTIFTFSAFKLPEVFRKTQNSIVRKVDDWQFHQMKTQTKSIIEAVAQRGWLFSIAFYSLVSFSSLYLVILILKLIRIVFFRYNNKKYSIKFANFEKFLLASAIFNTVVFLFLNFKIIPYSLGIMLLFASSALTVGLPSLFLAVFNLIKFTTRKLKSLSAGRSGSNLLLGLAGLAQSGIAPIALSLIIVTNFGLEIYQRGVGTTGIPMSKNINFISGSTKMQDTSENIGYSTGGAKDANNFRENILNGYLPTSSDITYEGVFYDYYFDRGESEQQKCSELFCPSYSKAGAKDPLSGQIEYYMTVGLNSNIKQSDFQRKKLNLIIVLDISGSMSSPFNKYYYDKFGYKNTISEEEISGDSKIKIARESLVKMTNHLEDEDRFSVVLFDGDSYLAKPLNLVSKTDMDSIREHILQIEPGGSTNMEAGYRLATEQFEKFSDIDKDEYENRIIFLTDMMPNTDQTNKDKLFGLTQENASRGIYTTFIGVGVDFNTELTDFISKVEGANYYSIHSRDEFFTRLDKQFEYMVTPLVFDLELTFESKKFAIKEVYGSPEADKSTGQLMKVNTLFPSPTKGDKTKGGVILLELEILKDIDDNNIKLTANYKDRNGNVFSNSSQTKFDLQNREEFYDNSGIQKAIVLSNYVTLAKNWINDERNSLAQNSKQKANINEEMGIRQPNTYELGKWEKQSTSLQISSEYKHIFTKFLSYLSEQKKILQEENFSQEEEVVNVIINSG